MDSSQPAALLRPSTSCGPDTLTRHQPPPQWHIIERVTAGQVHLATGDRDAASEALHTALTAADAHRLPHQVQRTVRAAASGDLTEITTKGQAALLRLNGLSRSARTLSSLTSILVMAAVL